MIVLSRTYCILPVIKSISMIKHCEAHAHSDLRLQDLNISMSERVGSANHRCRLWKPPQSAYVLRATKTIYFLYRFICLQFSCSMFPLKCKKSSTEATNAAWRFNLLESCGLRNPLQKLLHLKFQARGHEKSRKYIQNENHQNGPDSDLGLLGIFQINGTTH